MRTSLRYTMRSHIIKLHTDTMCTHSNISTACYLSSQSQSMAALRRASVSGSTPTSHIGGVTTTSSSSSSTSSSSSSSVKHSPVLVNRVVVDKDRINKEAMYWRAYAAAVSAQDPDEVSATATASNTYTSGLQCKRVFVSVALEHACCEFECFLIMKLLVSADMKSIALA
jgi:hypothetical protein